MNKAKVLQIGILKKNKMPVLVEDKGNDTSPTEWCYYSPSILISTVICGYRLTQTQMLNTLLHEARVEKLAWQPLQKTLLKLTTQLFIYVPINWSYINKEKSAFPRTNKEE